MSFESALHFLFALLVWAVIPGPAVFAIVGKSLTTGLHSALKLIAGILLGDILYISVALFGLAAIGKLFGDFFVIIRLLGASYLIFLGIRLWVKAPAVPGAGDSLVKPDTYRSFLTGFSITLGNPKAILFHLGFLPTFFDLAEIKSWDAALIIFIFIVVLGCSLSAYAIAASRARSLIRDKKKMGIVNRCSGTVLIGAGIAIAAKK